MSRWAGSTTCSRSRSPGKSTWLAAMMGSKSSELLMGAGLIRYASTSSQRFKRFKKTALGVFKAAVAHEHHMVAGPGLGQHVLKQFVNPAVGTARTAHLVNQGARVPVHAVAGAHPDDIGRRLRRRQVVDVQTGAHGVAGRRQPHQNW